MDQPVKKMILTELLKNEGAPDFTGLFCFTLFPFVREYLFLASHPY